MGEEEGEEEEKEEEGVGRRKGGGKKRKGKKKLKKINSKGVRRARGGLRHCVSGSRAALAVGRARRARKGRWGEGWGRGAARWGLLCPPPPPNPAAPAVRADALRSAPLCPTAVLTELAPIPPIHWGVGLAG